MATNVGKNRDILRRQRKKDGCFGRFFAFKPRGFVRGGRQKRPVTLCKLRFLGVVVQQRH